MHNVFFIDCKRECNMIEYKVLYKKIGNRKISHLLNPRIINDKDMVFPKMSILYWTSNSNEPTAPSEKDGYLANTKTAIVRTMDRYVGETIGRYRVDVSTRPMVEVSKFKKEYSQYKYLMPNITKYKVLPTTLSIFNFGLINSLYKYQDMPLTEYHRWYNNFISTITTVTNAQTPSSRNRFILIDVPQHLSSRTDLERLSKKDVTVMTMKEFTTPEAFNVFDIWRYLTPEARSTSILNAIPESEYEKITFMFRVANKITLLNMNILASIVEEYKIDGKLKKYKAVTIRKLFYVFLIKFITTSANDIANVDEDDSSMVDSFVESDLDIHSDTDVTSMLDKKPTKGKVDINTVLEDTSHTELAKDIKIEEVIEEVDDIDKIVDDVLHNHEITTKKEEKEIIAQSQLQLEDVMKSDDSKIVKNIETYSESGIITKAKRDKLLKSIDNNMNGNINLPNLGNIPIAKATNVTKQDLVITNKDSTIPDRDIVDEKDTVKDTVAAYTRKYINNVYYKDIASVVYSLQNADVVVDDYTVTRNDDILGGMETHAITVTPINGSPTTIKISMPIINDNGEFTMSGNKYRARLQRSEIPIVKIDNNKVLLSSYYGKVFVTKAIAKKDDIGYHISKKLISMFGTDNDLKDLVLLPPRNMDVKLPLVYGYISRYVKSFKYKDTTYSFEYDNRYKLLKDKTQDRLKQLESNGHVLVGVDKDNNPVVMGMDNSVWVFSNNSYKQLDDILTMLNIDINLLPIEYASIRIYKEQLPVAFLLSYYIGLANLLRVLNVKYTIVDKSRIKHEDGKYVVKFKDKMLIITKTNGYEDMILSGLLSMEKITKDIDYKIFNVKNDYSLLFSVMGLPSIYKHEIDLIEDMFVDPITKTILIEMNEPTTFKGLMIRSAELLVDDTYTNPNDVTGFLIKGYERFAGMMYNEMVSAIKANNNKSVFSRGKISINPYSVWNRIGEDSTTVLVDDLNPIAELKQSQDLTYLGYGGRSKMGMNRESREVHPSEIGIVSEATKDSGDVGISMYLTTAPKITSVRGFVELYDKDKDSIASTLSVTSLLLPGATKDDIKRSKDIVILTITTVL